MRAGTKKQTARASTEQIPARSMDTPCPMDSLFVEFFIRRTALNTIQPRKRPLMFSRKTRVGSRWFHIIINPSVSKQGLNKRRIEREFDPSVSPLFDSFLANRLMPTTYPPTHNAQMITVFMISALPADPATNHKKVRQLPMIQTEPTNFLWHQS